MQNADTCRMQIMHAGIFFQIIKWPAKCTWICASLFFVRRRPQNSNTSKFASIDQLQDAKPACGPSSAACNSGIVQPTHSQPPLTSYAARCVTLMNHLSGTLTFAKLSLVGSSRLSLNDWDYPEWIECTIRNCSGAFEKENFGRSPRRRMYIGN